MAALSCGGGNGTFDKLCKLTRRFDRLLFSCRNERYSKGLSITLVLLPVIIGTVIMLVSDSFARAFGLAGAFSIIRFRSTQGNPKDLAYIFAGPAEWDIYSARLS